VYLKYKRIVAFVGQKMLFCCFLLFLVFLGPGWLLPVVSCKNEITMIIRGHFLLFCCFWWFLLGQWTP